MKEKSDENELAFSIIKKAVESGGAASKNLLSEMAKLLSNKGASNGGKARHKKLSAKRRSEIARMGAKARHKKH